MARESSFVWEDSCRNVNGWLHLGASNPCPFVPILTEYSRLGDRHCENILLDTNTGDLVHVDFNCLFEKVSLMQSLSDYSMLKSS